MKVLILGSDGMMGHKLFQVLSDKHTVYGTVRSRNNILMLSQLNPHGKIIDTVDVKEIFNVSLLIGSVKPHVVVNCVGLVKSEIKDNSVEAIQVNSLFPHQLKDICIVNKCRLIHISTDCVFSGREGNYNEYDKEDAFDIYGKSKCLGEISGNNILTLRTSLIGREIGKKRNLVEWLVLNRHGKVFGYDNHFFSGFPTLHFVQILKNVIEKYEDLQGIYHVSSSRISKYELLGILNEKMGLGITIHKVQRHEMGMVTCDRSLDSSMFRNITGFQPKSWDSMIKEFTEDAKRYE